MNDVINDVSAATITRHILDMKRSVKVRMAGGEMNSFAACTLPLPPMCTSLPSEGRVVGVNRIQEMSALTTNILAMNKGSQHSFVPERCAPQFHTWGLRSANKPSPQGSLPHMGKMYGCRPSYWREDKFEKMLHLSDVRRLKAGRAVIKYFKSVAGVIEPDQPRSTQTGSG